MLVKANLALHAAAEAGDLARAEALLTEDPYLTTITDGLKETALHRAAAAGHAEAAQLLLAHSAAVDPVSHAGRTPLHHAAEGGHLAVAQALLDHKAKPNLLNAQGETPLHLAAQQKVAAAGRSVSIATETFTSPVVAIFGISVSSWARMKPVSLE